MRANVFVRMYSTAKSEKRYYLTVRERGHQDQTIQLGPVNKKVAEERRIMVLHELLNGTYQRVSLVRLAFGEFCERFMSEYAHGIMAPRTLALYKDRLKLVRRFFEKHKLDQIRQEDLETFLVAQKHLGPRSKNILLSIIRQVFQKAVEWKYLATSPAQKIKRWREESVGSNALTETELGRLLDVATPWQQTIIKVAVFTGMRSGELSQFQFRDIDWESHTLMIVSNHDRKTKSRKSRVIPMTEDLEETLRFLQTNYPNPQYGCGGFDTLHYLPRTQGQMEYVFCQPDGKPIGTFVNTLRKVFARAGITGVSMHGLRKTFCTMLATRGADIKSAQVLMGHSDPRLTLQVYTQVNQGHLRQAVSNLPSLRELQKEKFKIINGSKY